MDYKVVLQKIFKGALFSGLAAVFVLAVPVITNVSEAKKAGVVVLIAFISGALHGIWDAGKQYYQNQA